MSGDRLRPSIRPGLSRTQVSTVPTHPGFLAGRCPYLKDEGPQLPPGREPKGSADVHPQRQPVGGVRGRKRLLRSLRATYL